MSAWLLPLLAALPAASALLAWRARGMQAQSAWLVGAAVAHLALVAAAWVAAPPPALGGLLGLDPLGRLFLTLVSVLFLAAAVYAIPYLAESPHDEVTRPERFVPCLLGFLAAMSLVCVSRNLALLWAAVEATTLASAPLIYFYRRPGALEAAWKYLLICSVGIALALLGTFFLGIASTAPDGRAPGLGLDELLRAAPGLDRQWLRAAFVLVLVGYGTKMGLAPLHAWLPDAHGQAPSPVSALLSGALLNCALLGILRFLQISEASGDAAFAHTLLLVLGCASLAVGAALLLGQRDYKRLLAYSSVENMGLIAVGLGVAGAATYGALLHAVNHSLVKAALFLVTGNVLRCYGTTESAGVRGVRERLPASAALLAAGALAIGGAPPFGPFLSKLVIVFASLETRPVWLGALVVSLLGVGFVGVAGAVFPMLGGSSGAAPAVRERWLALAPPVALTAAVALMGVAMPEALDALLRESAALLSSGASR